jgi:23S rRNA (pseudouridine1915-N3)-methyltransferase
MKFNEINQEKWIELKPYLDTCLLPVTGLEGHEEPWQVAHQLEQLRDALAILEVPFHGRIVTYPSYHYAMNVHSAEDVNELCKKIKKSGYAFVVVITIHREIARWQLTDADEFMYLDMDTFEENKITQSQQCTRKMIELWASR